MTLLAGAGLYINSRLRASAVDHAIELVPANARAYLHVFLKPSTTQRRALRDLLEKFPSTDEEDEAETFVTDLLRDVLGRLDVDVDPENVDWLGNEVAAYLPVGSSDPILLIAVDDEEEARSLLSDALDGRPNLAIEFVDGFAVIGPSLSIDASEDARDGSSLATSTEYENLMNRLDDDRIALVFIRDSFGPYIPDALATLRIEDTDVIVDAVAPAGEKLGSARGFFVAGLSGINGGFSIEVPAQLGVENVTSFLETTLMNVGTIVDRNATGFQVAVPEPFPSIVVTTEANTVSASLGPPEGEAGELPVRLAEASRSRLGRDYEPAFVVDVSTLPAAARLPFFGPGAAELRPPLEQFLTLDLGVREDGPFTLGRLVIRFSDA